MAKFETTQSSRRQVERNCPLCGRYLPLTFHHLIPKKMHRRNAFRRRYSRSELAAGIFFQRFMRPFAFKEEPDEELVSKITEKRLPPMLDYLESQVPADGFLYGDFMMADLSIVSPFINAAYAGYEVDATNWPSVAGLIARVREVPAVKAVLEQEAKALGFG